MSRRLLLPVLACLLALGASSADALRVPGAPRCTVFPKSNPWNRRVDTLPVAREFGRDHRARSAPTGLHADFGSGLWEGAPIGIPFDVVTRKTPRTRVAFEYADESDHVRYPIPKRVHIEGGGSDHHALLLDRDACRLYELGRARRSAAAAGTLGRRDVEPALEPRAAGGLDVRRRGGAADLPGTRALRRGARAG